MNRKVETLQQNQIRIYNSMKCHNIQQKRRCINKLLIYMLTNESINGNTACEMRENTIYIYKELMKEEKRNNNSI